MSTRRRPFSAGPLLALALAVSVTPAGSAPAAVPAELSAFRLRHGDAWRLAADPASGRPRRLAGGAMAWFDPSTAVADGALLELASAFVADHGALLGMQPSEWSPPRHGSIAAAGPLLAVRLERRVSGVLVEGASLTLVASNGRLIGVHAVGTEPVAPPPRPRVSSRRVWASALDASGFGQGEVELRAGPELRLVREGGARRLAWRLVVASRDRPARLLVVVDASTGRVSVTDQTVSQCAPPPASGRDRRVVGGVRVEGAGDAEREELLAYVSVGGAVAGGDGFFTAPPPPYEGRLSGPAVTVECVECDGPALPTAPATADGDVDFGSGGADEVGNGTSTPADRAAYFHVEAARRLGRRWLDLTYLEETLPVRTNFPSSCNAYWDGAALTFFRSSGTCGNTGEIRDVIAHEWGHGLDDNDGLPASPLEVDAATGEAVGDIVAMILGRDACVGEGFFEDPSDHPSDACSGVRDLDELAPGHERGSPATLDTAGARFDCPASAFYRGPLGAEGHCEGEIFGQAFWHLVQDLATGTAYVGGAPLPTPALGEDEAWQVVERLFFASRPLLASYAPASLQDLGMSAHEAFLLADDEGDGLGNGTPHAGAIHEAFAHHGMQDDALLAVPTSSPCAAPPAPVVTPSTVDDPASGRPATRLDWTDSGATLYHVLRSDGPGEPFLPATAALPGDVLAFVDRRVLPLRTYSYVVIAEGVNGCTSGASGAVVAAVGAYLQVAAVAVDDTAGGDGDGLLQEGEEAEVAIDLANAGGADATRTDVTLTTDDPALVVVDGGPLRYGTVPAFGGASAPSPFRLRADPGVGRYPRLIVEMESAEGCFRDERVLEIAVPDVFLAAHRIDDARGGDGDLDWRPGEAADLWIALEDTGLLDAAGVQGDLRFAAGPVPGIAIVEATATWPLLVGRGPSAESTLPFVLEADAGLGTRTRIPLALDISVGGAFHRTQEVTVEVGGFPPGCLEWGEPLADMPTPIVLQLTDDDGDGRVGPCDVADVVHVTRDDTLVARSGDTGELLWELAHECTVVFPFDALAGGDVNGDGLSEIVLVDMEDHACAISSDGRVLWHTDELMQGQAPQLWDLDGDGLVEVVLGQTVLAGLDGSVIWSHEQFLPRRSLVADLDLDGTLEVVSNWQAFDHDGEEHLVDGLRMNVPNGGRQGADVVTQQDDDPYPEFVIHTGPGIASHDHDGTQRWLYAIPDGRHGQGPLCAGDVDGDGYSEVGVQTELVFHLLDHDGTDLWTAPMDDTSGAAGCSMFDFEGDGFPEVLLQDQVGLQIFDGRDGALLWAEPMWSGTAFEHPIVADVDGDGSAEIVMLSNANGDNVRVYGNPLWAPARSIWNQEDYVVANVNDDGTVPPPPALEDRRGFMRGQVAGEPCRTPTWGIDVSRPDCGVLTACFAPRLPERMEPTGFWWDFGDGAPPSTAPAPCHEYAAAGDYTVTMRVTYGPGCVVEHETVVSLRDEPTVEVLVDWACGRPACLSAVVTGGLPPYAVEWELADGSPRVQGEQVCHAYPAGTFGVTAFARDANGCRGEREATVVIDDPVVLPEVSAPGSAVPLTVRLEAGRLLVAYEATGLETGLLVGDLAGLRRTGYAHGATGACGDLDGLIEAGVPAADAYLLVAATACDPTTTGPLGAGSSGGRRPTPEELGLPRCP